MTPYKNLGGDSGVVAYKKDESSIIVQFREGNETFYKYTNASAGSGTIEHMKKLADYGQGLNSFISTNKPPYAAKGITLSSVE